MPYRVLPRSDAERSAALQEAFAKWNATPAAERLLTPAQFDQLRDDPSPVPAGHVSSLRVRFARELNDAGVALSSQSASTEAHVRAFAALEQGVSHFFQVFNLAVQRDVFKRADRAYYGQDISRSDVPPMPTYADIERVAAAVVGGERERQSRGGMPMAMPSGAELAALLTAARAIAATQSTLKDRTQTEQEQVAALREPADALILDLWDTVEFALRRLPGPARRRRAREWGLRYVLRPDEPEDPAEGTPPIPPTP